MLNSSYRYKMNFTAFLHFSIEIEWNIENFM